MIGPRADRIGETKLNINELAYLNGRAKEIEEKVESYSHHFSKGDDEIVGQIGEYRHSEYYGFRMNPINDDPYSGDGKVDYEAIYTPTGERLDISITTRSRDDSEYADLPIYPFKATCDWYFLYETDYRQNPFSPYVGLVGYATHYEVINHQKAFYMNGRENNDGEIEYPHLVLRHRLHAPPEPDELIPI